MKTEKTLIKYVTPTWLPWVIFGVILIILGFVSTIGDNLVGLLIFGLLGLVYAAWFCVPVIRIRRQIKTLQDSGEIKDVMKDYIDGRKYLMGKLICGENYVFGKKTGAITKYADIKRVYMQIEKTNAFTKYKALVAHKKDNKTVVLGYFPLKNEEIGQELEDVLQEIADNNPDVQIGFKGFK